MGLDPSLLLRLRPHPGMSSWSQEGGSSTNPYVSYRVPQRHELDLTWGSPAQASPTRRDKLGHQPPGWHFCPHRWCHGAPGGDREGKGAGMGLDLDGVWCPEGDCRNHGVSRAWRRGKAESGPRESPKSLPQPQQRGDRAGVPPPAPFEAPGQKSRGTGGSCSRRCRVAATRRGGVCVRRRVRVCTCVCPRVMAVKGDNWTTRYPAGERTGYLLRRALGGGTMPVRMGLWPRLGIGDAGLTG